jgi:RHS repeat-associated protein
MGKLWKTEYPNNVTNEVYLEWCTEISDPPISTGIYPLYKVHNKSTKTGLNGSVDTYSYFDSWSRNVINKSEYMRLYDGSNITTAFRENSTQYYSNGMIDTKYDLFIPGTSEINRDYKTKYNYDTKGRIENTLTKLGNIELFNELGYNNKSIIESYDGAGGGSNRRSTTRTVDAAGNFISKEDADCNSVNASYFHNGQVKEINGVLFTYDEIGRKIKMEDPNAGTIEYYYDLFGNIKCEKHLGKSKKYFTYNSNGRLESSISKKFNTDMTDSTEEATTSYIYYELDNELPSNGLGQIRRVRYDTPIVEQFVYFAYDDKGRLTDKIETIKENGRDSVRFKTKYEYDDYGRLHYKTLPSVTNTSEYGIKLEYIYNNFDEIIEINKYNGSNYDNVWRITNNDIYGKPFETSVGKFNNIITNYIYDDQQRLASKETTNSNNSESLENWSIEWEPYTGNMNSRTYSSGNISNFAETYTYDNLDRLVVGSEDDDINLSGNNIETKVKAGGYLLTYDNDDTDPRFVDKHAADNAVKQIEVESLNDIPTYSDISTYNQVLTYTSFNSIETITETIPKVGAANGTVIAIKTFYYGVDGQRILMISKEIDDENEVEVSRKYYSGEFEYTLKPSNIKKEVSYISAPAGLVAADVKEGTESVLYYILTDQLGSITQLLYYTNTSQCSTLTSAGKFTYDAWGRLRDITQTSDVYNTLFIRPAFEILDRGYTGHEHLLDHAIINMNGRIYDPIVGQFMQADNFIQTPEDYIGYNRYAYCRYNPFKYTDPSGEMLINNLDRSSENGFFAYNPATISLNACETEEEARQGEIESAFNIFRSLTSGVGGKGKKKSDSKSDTKTSNISNSKSGKSDTSSKGKGDGSISFWKILKMLFSSSKVAVDFEVNVSASSGFSVNGVPAGGIFMLQGRDAFELVGYSAAGFGYGLLGASATLTTMNYYYYGDIKNFDKYTFSGWSSNVNVGGGEFLQGGFSVSWLRDEHGGYLIGVGYGGGVGAPPGVSASWIWQNTTLWNGKK